MNFAKAVKAMNTGAFVRRKSWTNWQFYCAKKYGYYWGCGIQYKKDILDVVSVDDLTAEDWFISAMNPKFETEPINRRKEGR